MACRREPLQVLALSRGLSSGPILPWFILSMSEPFPCVQDHTLAPPWDGGQSPSTNPLLFCSFQHCLNLPEPPNYHFFFFSFWATFLGRVIFTVSLPSSLSFTLCGLAPDRHPRDFPHQGHCGLLDMDMIHSLPHLISLQPLRWLTTSPFW